jgi:DNA-directed RNA polymerase subunit RPC12/RpoP
VSVDELRDRVRVQAEQIAALQEALRKIADLTVNIGDSVQAATRASWIAVEALTLAEGCAVDTVPPHIGTGVPLVKGPTMSAAVNRPPFGSYTAETCPDRAKHTSDPAGYIAWHERAEKKAKTHDQHQCPTCGYRVIWKRKSKSVSAPAEKETR